MIQIIILFYIMLLVAFTSSVIPALIILYLLYSISKKYKSKALIGLSINFIVMSGLAILTYLNTEFSGDPPSFANTYFLIWGFLSIISLIILLSGIHIVKDNYLNEQQKKNKKKKQR